ncbi:MAG: HAMP domain-containing histidine kinase [Planctomycetes bacterium]|nr:HAMP domain-containing histidine kinase [Planctomycetota bacterium]
MRRPTAIVFGLVVLLCLGQVAWWIVFQLQESARLERAADALSAGDVNGALGTFGVETAGALADAAHDRRVMFAYEGATLGLLVLVGIVFFYVALVREQRMRRDHERFLTGATHELKTPLTTLRLGLESIARDTLPAERRGRYLDAMLREADRLERGLTNVLAAAGLEDSLRRPRVTADLADDVRRALETFADRFAAAGLQCEAERLDSCPVLRDEGSLRLVLHNLLDNAIKYSKSGGHVSVDVQRLGDHARVTVADTGCGIATHELSRIFERFHRAGPAHVGGTGLGLALVRELVEAHGGRVRAESAGEGHGSRFTVDLPLADAARGRPGHSPGGSEEDAA